jgi:hypothetical protein
MQRNSNFVQEPTYNSHDHLGNHYICVIERADCCFYKHIVFIEILAPRVGFCRASSTVFPKNNSKKTL